MRLRPVILSGGSGSRLWPLSRAHYPKQLLPLVDELTMLQATVERLAGLPEITLLPPIVVCNEEHRFLVAEQLRQVGATGGGVILEPVGRNTAPALTLAALQALQDPQPSTLLVMPADHVIQDRGAFHEAILAALRLGTAQRFITFGIVPTYAETGYGYIRRGAPLGEDAWQVGEFVEKPNQARAAAYLQAGEYYWNSGMFMLQPHSWLEAITRFRPEIATHVEAAYQAAVVDQDFIRIDATAFKACPSDSIDYAVMEAITQAGEASPWSLAVLPLAAGWSDVGAWSALWEIHAKDGAGNVVKGDVLLEECRDSLVISEHTLVACLGVSEMVVVATADAILVAPKARAQEVKKLVEQLDREGRNESVTHRRVPRPWGCYETMDLGERFQVKRITVNPGAALSLQLHHHRAEHWVVVKGTAKVTCGDNSQLISENRSTYIPIGVPHRLENPGVIPLEMIEIQSGSYLGEDDIVRLDDRYGR